MPVLNLDHNQRLNLVAILDGLESQGRREAFAVCRLQETIDLNDREREAVGLKKMKTPDGRDYVMWQPNVDTVPAREYELPDADVDRICRALDNYRVVLGRDRLWWEPLIAQLPSPAESNGEASAASPAAAALPPPPKNREDAERSPAQPKKKEKAVL